jgi:hypothetical protein
LKVALSYGQILQAVSKHIKLTPQETERHEYCGGKVLPDFADHIIKNARSGNLAGESGQIIFEI